MASVSDEVRVPRRLLLELVQLVETSLEHLDAISRSRWEHNKLRIELDALLQSAGLSEVASAAQPDGYDEKTPVRRPSAALRAARLEDDEPTRPDLPQHKRRPR